MSPNVDIRDESVDWESEVAEVPRPSSGSYQSPLLQRVSSARLTSEMLREEIPKVKAGEEAAAALAKATARMGDKRRGALAATVEEGQRAKQRLFEAALPLIRTVAKREWSRRQQWGSQVSLEDLTQEATVGFLKGLSSFNTDAIGRSATNYLGQWMLVETRRAAESMDHDLQVGHDAGERFRRIRALRNRLMTELGREPTDEEISEASRNPDYVTRPGMVGRAPAEGEKRQSGKGVTEAQVAEERLFRSRLGHANRFGNETDDDSDGAGFVVDPGKVAASPVDSTFASSVSDTPEELAMAGESARVVAALIEQSMNKMNMPALQRDIIARRYGIPPYEETSAREIAKILGVQRDRVSRVLSAFQQEMTRPGGAFHATLNSYDSEDLRSVGLGWAITTLGPWEGASNAKTPSILSSDIPSNPVPASKAASGSTRARGVIAFYICDFHDRTFSSLYPDARSAPKTRPCPTCGKPSERLKVAPAAA